MAFTAEGTRTEAAIIIQVTGEVNAETAPEMTRICSQSILPGDRNMVLNLSKVQYMSSAGLSSVLSAGKEMSRQGGQILICGLTPRLKQIFTISGFEMIFPMYESQEAALAACGPKRNEALGQAAHG